MQYPITVILWIFYFFGNANFMIHAGLDFFQTNYISSRKGIALYMLKYTTSNLVIKYFKIMRLCGSMVVILHVGNLEL